MLGFFLSSLTLLSLPNPRPVLAAIPFVLSLCFKQMGLYYAPAIFIYLLSLSFPRLRNPNIPLLAVLGIVVITTFGLIFFPFILPHQVLSLIAAGDFKAVSDLALWSPNQWDIEMVTQIFHRVFPFGRGLWEDKVANIWCASNILIKWREVYSSAFLQKLRYALFLSICLVFTCMTDDSMAATLVAISPALAHAWLHPNAKKPPEVFTLTALGFFLCSFQVHEKSILLPLLPASLGLFSSDPRDRQWTVWINIIGTISYSSICFFCSLN